MTQYKYKIHNKMSKVIKLPIFPNFRIFATFYNFAFYMYFVFILCLCSVDWGGVINDTAIRLPKNVNFPYFHLYGADPS